MYKKVMVFLYFLSQTMYLVSDDTLGSASESVVLDHGKNKENMFDFKYDQKNLRDILNFFAAKKGINIMYPEVDPLVAQVTFDAGKKVSLKTGWELVIMLLDKAGFSLLPRGKDLYVLIANSALSSEQLPLYIDVHFSSLPDSVEKIRYMFYFENIQLSLQKNSIDAVLKTIFPATDYSKMVIYDMDNNGIIFSGTSSLIRSAMIIINTLDEPGYKEQIELLNLKYTGAADVVTILHSLLQNDTTPKRGYISQKSSTTQATYFETGTKVVSLDPKNIRKINTIIVFGKSREVAKVIAFIKKHIDIPQEEGKVFYHVVSLQHLTASNLATQLNSLIAGGKSYSSQSTGSMTSDLGFDSQTKILVESISVGASKKSSSLNKNQVQRGGNRLIVVANNRDWIRLEKLIQDLDKPQKQVIIEALILDLSVDFTRQLSAQVRTSGLTPSIFPKYLQAQAGLLAASQINSSATDYTLLLGNLNKILGSANTENSTIVMVDGAQASGVWAFFQLISNHTNVKVTTRPFVVAQNNQVAEVTSVVTKKLPSTVNAGVAATVSYKDETAPVTIQFTPLISDNNEVNLQNNIDVTYWNDSDDSNASNQKNTRTLTNNVSLRSGDVLILGGLTRSKINRTRKEVPFLSKIPILGHFFSSKVQTVEKNQLFILIRPTIIEPRLQGGMGSMTKTASRLVKTEILEAEATFSNLKDPINRWFFGKNAIASEAFDNNLKQMYEADGIAVDQQIDTRYKRDIEDVEPQNSKKRKEEAAEKTEFQKEQQQLSNKLQYKLHEAKNPFDSKKSKRKATKLKRSKAT